jgi:hypothetical protein
VELALGNTTSLPVLHFFTDHEGDSETAKGERAGRREIDALLLSAVLAGLGGGGRGGG